MHRSANGCVLCMQHMHDMVLWFEMQRSAAQRRASGSKIGLVLVLSI
jgi:hypothetical protein